MKTMNLEFINLETKGDDYELVYNACESYSKDSLDLLNADKKEGFFYTVSKDSKKNQMIQQLIKE